VVKKEKLKKMANEQQKVVTLDPQVMMQMLASMLQAQAQTTKVQQQILDLELAKKEALEKREFQAAATLERRKQQSLGELRRKNENDKRRWEACPHEDQKGGSKIWPISNFPDHLLRGYCTDCGIFIEPAHYEEDAEGRKTLIPQHPLYHIVIKRDAQIYAGFVPLTSY